MGKNNKNKEFDRNALSCQSKVIKHLTLHETATEKCINVLRNVLSQNYQIDDIACKNMNNVLNHILNCVNMFNTTTLVINQEYHYLLGRVCLPTTGDCCPFYQKATNRNETKKAESHLKKNKEQNSCIICVQFLNLQIYHAKKCKSTQCAFLFCDPTKKLLEQFLKRNLCPTLRQFQFPVLSLNNF